MSKRWLIVLFSIAAFLRLGFIWMAPAWYDENFTLLVSRLPLDRMWAAVIGDVHPPLWYLLIWPLGQVDSPIWAIRIPAALFSLAAMWVFWRILLVLDLSPRVRTAALVLMAVMPIQLYYAQEARMYALLEFLVLAAVLAMLQRRWWLFGLAGALMLYTQYYGFFYLITIYFVAVFLNDHKQLFKLCLAYSLALLAFFPWVLVLNSQMHTLSGSYWMQLTGPGMVLRVLFEALFMPPQNAVIQIPLMLAGFAWLAVGIIYAIRRGEIYLAPTMRTVFALAFLPFAFAIIFSLLWQPVLHYRPLIAITPFLYILLAGPVDALFEKPEINMDRALSIGPLLRLPDALSILGDIDIDRLYDYKLNLRRALLTAIFILPLLLVCDGAMYLYARPNKTPGAAAEMTYIQSHWQTGDVVYHFSDDSWVNSAASGLPMVKAPDCGPTLGALSPATRLALGQRSAPLADLAYTRAWLIWQDGPTDPACNLAQRPAGDPVLVSQNDEYVFDGLWLVEK